MKVLNITHQNCLDGSTSAWLVRRAFCAPTDTVVTLYYTAGAPLLRTSSVVRPDEEYSRERFDLILVTDTSFTVDEMCYLETLGPVVLLDHHETAHKRLKGTGFDEHLSKTMSGALLTYNYLCDHDYKLPDESYIMAQYVSDADLWAFKLPDSRAIAAYLSHTVDGPEAVGKAALSLLTSFGHCKVKGETLIEARDRQVAEVCKRAAPVMIGGYDDVPCVNSSLHRSEVGNALARTSPHGFSVVWWFENGKVCVSFRAVDDSAKCLKIAEEWGGGGHVRACGASLSYIDWDEIVSGRSFGG